MNDAANVPSTNNLTHVLALACLSAAQTFRPGQVLISQWWVAWTPTFNAFALWVAPRHSPERQAKQTRLLRRLPIIQLALLIAEVALSVAIFGASSSLP